MPVARDGERLVFDKQRKAEPGDYVAIWFRTETDLPECWVKLLVAEEADAIVVEQFNPRRRYRLDRNKVAAMHYCTMSLMKPRPLR
jgi:hypothetical protein